MNDNVREMTVIELNEVVGAGRAERLARRLERTMARKARRAARAQERADGLWGQLHEYYGTGGADGDDYEDDGRRTLPTDNNTLSP